jgi:prevent-host-death family protein
MDTVAETLSVRELRANLAEVIGRAAYGHERIGVTKNGHLAVVVIGVDDLEALEAWEMAADVAAYDEAKATDDGSRISLDAIRTKYGV